MQKARRAGWSVWFLFFALLLGCDNRSGPVPLVVGVLVGPEYSGQADIIKRAAESAAMADGRGRIVTEIIENPTIGGYRDAIKKLLATKVGNNTVMGLVISGNPDYNIDEEIRGITVSGRPVIVFGQDIPRSLRDIFVSCDSSLEGTVLAQVLSQSASSGNKVIAILAGPEKNEIQRQRLSALRNELAQHASIKTLKTINYVDSAQMARDVGELIQRAPTLFAIVSTGPWIFEPQVQKVLSGYKGQVFAIANTPAAFEAMKLGHAQALIVEDIYSQVYKATEYCLARLRNEVVNSPSPLESVLVTPENLTSILSRWGREPLKAPERSAQKPSAKGLQ